jgi:hypothetical protein
MPIVMLETVAGMGKSVLLAQIADVLGLAIHSGLNPPNPREKICLWDIPNTGNCRDLPADFLTGQSRIILAKRPNHQGFFPF